MDAQSQSSTLSREGSTGPVGKGAGGVRVPGAGQSLGGGVGGSIARGISSPKPHVAGTGEVSGPMVSAGDHGGRAAGIEGKAVEAQSAQQSRVTALEADSARLEKVVVRERVCLSLAPPPPLSPPPVHFPLPHPHSCKPVNFMCLPATCASCCSRLFR